MNEFIQKWGAVLTAGGTTTVGVAGLWQLLNPLLSAVTMVCGLFLSVILGYGRIKKGRIERQILYLERDALVEKAAARRKAGLPCQREEDST